MASDGRAAASVGGALAVIIAMALSACAPVSGDDGSDSPPAAEKAAAQSSPEAAADAAEADPAPLQAPEKLTKGLTGKKVPRMGKVVTDEDGFILYRFDEDTADPPASNCYDDCEKVWPPSYTDGNPVVKGIDAALVGSVTREDGTRQLTVNGWPVYRYIGDKKSGQWRGQAVGGKWFVIAPDGKKNLTCLPKGTPKAVPPPADSDPADSDATGEDEAPAGDGGYGY